ncbi:MAG TPA: hypothetical protein P5117_14005 [Spirochaetia bacterium]|nr:hypothetical protein [Spirochaetales bacterium]HRZ90590.1 hypothetical protein [Spirochaetia bacterium]
MRIETVAPGDRNAVRRFIRVPFDFLAGEENWVPPLAGELRVLLRRRHPFFEHSDAAFFLASEHGRDLGRIAVLDHRGYNGHHGTRTAFFCHFDVRDDGAAARALLDAASEWAAIRGLDRLIGPKGFLRSAGQGVLVDGFDRFPATGIPWNPPYYAGLLEASGFSKVTDFLSGYLDRNRPGDGRLYRVAEIARKRGAFEILAFRRRGEIRRWLPALKILQHEAFADNPNYVPSTDGEFALMSESMIFAADPSVVRFILRDGELAGFMGAFPNLGRGIRRAGGELLPLGWYHILRERSRSRILDLNGLGILPKFRKMGGDAILFAELERLIRSSRYESVEFIQVDERNFLSRSGIEHFGVDWAKRHRMYGKDLGGRR